jgi:DNA invertase Pin-like site-specific DNA recombinase
MDADTLAAAQARHAKGQTPTQIAKALRISRATIYRHLTSESARGCLAAEERDHAGEFETNRGGYIRRPFVESLIASFRKIVGHGL